ncbi:hypothetical protein KC678_04990 [Candidatus Dojkabacteria bacterium]|uniref:Uncharacterized protein n=1 Tax=Candidatus Dojkabacteria bacterium TaxID=2099670 RepID=A0A955RGR7_9BACT|nr:hypothetical protein [Candidatus Dojkabacteria bacterium]
MERLGMYKVGFGISFILTILLWSSSLSNIVVPAIFIGLTLIYLFRFEESIESEEYKDQIPEVHYYQSLRYNKYNYTILGFSIVLITLYGFFFALTSLPKSLVTLVFWLMIILVSDLVQVRINKFMQINLISDYIFQVVPVDIEKIKELTRVFINLNEQSSEKLEFVLSQKTDWPQNLREEFVKRYLEYLDLLENIESREPVSDEIEELNH